MNSPDISPVARQVETQFDQPCTNYLQGFVRGEVTRELEGRSLPPSKYDLYAVRRNQLAGDEVLGPKTLHVGSYSEELLYGASGSDTARFRSAINALAVAAKKVADTDPDTVEYGHQVSLFWSDTAKVKSFLGAASVVTEIAAELRTARFQFIGKDTPVEFMRAMAQALQMVAEAKRIDEALVDRFVDVLEAGGFDSFAVDALRDHRG